MLTLVVTLLLSSPWACRGFDVNAHHDLGPGFLSQRPPTDTIGHVHRVVGSTFREKIHESHTPFVVKFCDGEGLGGGPRRRWTPRAACR